MNPSGLQAAVVLPTLADLGCLPLPCASGAAEASDSIGGAEQKKNSNTYLSTESGEVHTKARDASKRALELDPDLAEAHAALGNYLMNHEWDWSGAATRLRHAISLDPYYSSGRQWYSNYLMCLGHEDEAVTQATFAHELDPESPFLYSSLARHFQLMRQPERAAEHFGRALELDPLFISARIGLALAELQCGRPDVCLAGLEELAAQADREIPLDGVPLTVEGGGSGESPC